MPDTVPICYIVSDQLRAMVRDGLNVLFYNIKDEEIIVYIGTAEQGPVVMQRLETTCGKHLSGYHVSVRTADNDEVAGAVYMKDGKK
ncbi:MAG: hypothetical protein JW881_21995 [Spirochaetales bacterium]|nr:hypothetical protein [Spirochaetales bacterium]